MSIFEEYRAFKTFDLSYECTAIFRSLFGVIHVSTHNRYSKCVQKCLNAIIGKISYNYHDYFYMLNTMGNVKTISVYGLTNLRIRIE